MGERGEFVEAWGTKLRKEKREESSADEKEEVKTEVCMSAYVNVHICVQNMPPGCVFLEKGDSSMRYWATEELYSLSACRPHVHTKKTMNDCSSPPKRKSFLKHTA